MKRPVHDHGAILHFAGAHHLFPVKGEGADDVSFATHGDAAGRTPIGWHAFFPALRRTGRTVHVDDEAGTATIE